MPKVNTDDVTLQLLNAIEENQSVSQRSLSSRLGIAIGLTNAYVRRCMNKGWIKMKRAPARRYVYYLTPQGFAEKSRLTARYLSSSLLFFREARAQCQEALELCRRRGWRRVALYGTGDLAEIATLAARGGAITPLAVIAPGSSLSEFAGLPVVRELERLDGFDAVIVTDVLAPQVAYAELKARFADERILIPPLLRLSRSESKQREGT